MKFLLAAITCFVVMLPTSGSSRPADPGSRYLIEALTSEEQRPAGLFTLSNSVFGDTVFYGGTFWSADSNRWEAIRDSMWTFDTGVGSALGPTGPNKPAGYHTRMEGWFGLDQSLVPQPYFRRSSTCVISGSFSFWAGVTTLEASDLCYVSGQGYGNGWELEIRKTFAYGGSGGATLSYKYASDSEANFDFNYAVIDTTGNGSAEDITLRSYDGVVAGVETIPLVRGVTLRSTAGNVTIKFLVESDGSYSDEDGLNPSVCGAFAVDDVQLTGAITDLATFESGDDGWAQVIPTTGVGDFSNIVNVATDLPPPVTFCPCGFQDSVLVFFDTLDNHPIDQDNVAVSPWIDLKRNGDAGRPGKIIRFDVSHYAPFGEYVFIQVRARWYPSVCQVSGRIVTTPFRDQSVVFPDFGTPICARRLREYSSVIESGAEQVQIALGVINLCRVYGGTPCNNLAGTRPWFDNVELGIYGEAVAPTVTLLTFDTFQDAFATDGTLNPASPGRIDTSTIKNGSSPGPGSVLRDTLVARGDGGNTEVRLVFHVRPGPFTNPSALGLHQSRWTPEGSLGAGWYSVRMDTAEQAGSKSVPLGYMTTFHESDPGFLGTDRTPDPQDPSQLENEILPDHVFTPGSRIDYFVKARYIPPDPRNPGGTSWYVTPDTTGSNYHEVEILPSSMSADSSWNCALYVDHHDDRELASQRLEEDALTAALGAGGSNAEGTRFDRWDVETPSSGQLSFGRPIESHIGVSVLQVFGYRTIVWHSGTLSSLALTDEDANVLGPWLTLSGVGGNRFWGTGDGLATSMHASGEPSTINFLRNVLGTLRTCDTIRAANCPSTTALDSTYCLPTGNVAGAYFDSGVPVAVRGNGCPDLTSLDLLGRNTDILTTRGQLNYVKNGFNAPFASVTNYNTLNVNYKTVLDGYAFGRNRMMPANPHVVSLCTNTTAAVARAEAVLDWFGTPASCRIPGGIVDVPGSDTPVAPRLQTSLGRIAPNPMSDVTRIGFTNGLDGGRVTLRIFNVTGRLERTLLDAPLPAGASEIIWDGRTDGGKPVAAGLYFFRLTAEHEAFIKSEKVVVLR